MKVRDAMHKGAEWVDPETPVSEVAKKMKKLDIGAIPVGESDRLVGMVTDRDITCRAVASSKECSKLKARDVMTKGIVYCSDTEEIDDALRPVSTDNSLSLDDLERFAKAWRRLRKFNERQEGSARRALLN